MPIQERDLFKLHVSKEFQHFKAWFEHFFGNLVLITAGLSVTNLVAKHEQKNLFGREIITFFQEEVLSCVGAEGFLLKVSARNRRGACKGDYMQMTVHVVLQLNLMAQRLLRQFII